MRVSHVSTRKVFQLELDDGEIQCLLEDLPHAPEAIQAFLSELLNVDIPAKPSSEQPKISPFARGRASANVEEPQG